MSTMFSTRTKAARAVVLLGLLGAASASSAEWERASFPASRSATHRDVVSCAAGGFVAVGLISEIANVPSSQDAHVIKTDADGVALWERTYGRPGDNDVLVGVVELPGGDLVVAGTTGSLGPHSEDAWILRLSGATGDVAWQQVLAGDLLGSRTRSLDLAPDGRILLTALGALDDVGGLGAVIVQVDAAGAVLAQVGIDDLWEPRARGTADGGTIVSGDFWSGGGSWVARLDAAFAIDWQVTLDPSTLGQIRALGIDGNDAILSLQSSGPTGGVPGLIRLDALGNVAWQARVDHPGAFEDMSVGADGIRLAGAIVLPPWELRPAFAHFTLGGALLADRAYDIGWNLYGVTAGGAETLIAGELFVSDAQAYGASLLAVDASGTLGAACAVSQPIGMLVEETTSPVTPATFSPLIVTALAAQATTVVPMDVTSCVAQRCSSISCVDPCAAIASVDPLPACNGSLLTFEAVGQGNLPLVMEWDWDYTGTFDVDASGATASAWFGAAGTRTIALRVTDACAATGARTALATREIVVHACPPAADATWAMSLGGPGGDELVTAFELSGGGFIVAGSSPSFGASGGQAWMVRLDSSGAIAWNRTFALAGNRSATSAFEISPGQIALGGSEVDFAAGLTSRPWIDVIDAANGQTLSARMLGDSVDVTWHGGMTTLPSGGLAWCGSSNLARVVATMSDPDTFTWQQRMDAPDAWVGDGCDISAAPGGTVVTAGMELGRGWATAHDAAGAVTWQARLGNGGNLDSVTDVAALDDGAIVVGWTMAEREGDAWLVRLDATGSVAWERAIGGDAFDQALSVKALPGGDILVTGMTESFGQGLGDAWLLRLDATGTPIWQRSFGGDWTERALEVVQAADSTYLMLGSTLTPDGNLDAWLLRLDADARLAGACPLGSDPAATALAITSPHEPSLLTTLPDVRVAEPAAPVASDVVASSALQCASSLPAPPAQPELLGIGVDGPRLVLHFTLVADAESYQFYEFTGVIAEEGWLVQRYCHVTASDPAFEDLGDGTANFRLTPSRDLTSYLVAASNWLGESPLGYGSGGPLDDPPSPWRCGPNP